MMKRIISLALICLMLLSMVPITVAAAETTDDFDISALSKQTYYEQNFDALNDGTIDPAALGWDAVNSTATLEVKTNSSGNKELIIRETVDNAAKKSFFVLLPNTKNFDASKHAANSDVVTKKSYYVEFDFRFAEIGVNNTFALLLNYNRAATTESYSLLYLKCGTAVSSFTYFPDSLLDYTTPVSAIATTFRYPGGALAERKILQKDASVLPQILNKSKSATLLYDNTINVRVEVDNDEKVARVFVNDVYLTATNPNYKTDNERWTKFLSSGETELGFRIHHDKGDANPTAVAIDNIKVGSLDYPTVTFDTDGGSAVAAMSTNRQGKLTSVPTAPTKAGFTFAGWYNGTAPVELNATTTFYTNTTLTAKWTENTSAPTAHTVTFDAAGGTIAQTSMTTNAEGKLAVLPTVIRTGYIFDGWFTAAGEEVTIETVFTADTTLTAKWTVDPSLSGGAFSAESANLWLAVLVSRYSRRFDIQAAATDGGMITPAGTTRVKYNTSQTYTILPNAGYAIADVVVDGVSVGKVNSYTFKKVTKAHTISVVFEKREAEKSEVLYEENFDALKSAEDLG